MQIDELSRELKRNVSEINTKLIMLEVKGLVKKLPGSKYQLKLQIRRKLYGNEKAVNSGVTGKSGDNKKISWQGLYSYGVYGHIIDLPKSQMGIDFENDYTPKYITIRGKGQLLTQLKKEAKKADVVYLATDPDREGEAISWHLAEALKIDPESNCRCNV